jgi:serine/threonine protein phosphatase PrpC
VFGYDTIEYASLTDVGIRRSHNQDAHATLLASDERQWQERGHLFVVADGMGAHAVGELASELAVGIIPHTYHKQAAQNGVPSLRKAFIEANATIHAKGQQNPEFSGMGTTTTALLIRPEGAWIGHVGDSRVYRIRAGQIEQLSFDHSLVWEMARRHGVDPDGLQGIPSNVIVRSLGPEPLVEVDIEGPHPVQAGDIYLLCSDGLSGQLSDTEIGAIASILPPAEACRVLIGLANLRGGPDNITVLIVQVNEKARSAKPGGRGIAWYRRIPWSMTALLLGVFLAGGAGLLTKYSFYPLNVAVFLLAAAAIVSGLVGLLVIYNQERRRLANEPEAPRLQIYRQACCRAAQPLLEDLARFLTASKQQIQDKQWDADWTAYQVHTESAEKFVSQGNLVDALREYCRAVQPLAETVQRQRPRGEVFQPVWDKR